MVGHSRLGIVAAHVFFLFIHLAKGNPVNNKAMKYIAILLLVLTACSSPAHDKQDAAYEAKLKMESMLKSPSTAQFGSAQVEKVNENTYHVFNTVDAQNSFGATVRKNYECDVIFTEDGKQFKIKNFEVY